MWLLFLISVTAVMTSTFALPDCPEGWVHFYCENSCLKGYTEKKNFQDASQVCQNEGANLVIVRSEAKNKLVTSLITNDQHTWIGLWDKDHTQQWTFVDGSPLSSSYKPWSAGEPNNWSNSEACGHIIGRGDIKGLWNDINCASSLAFVCEKPGN